MLCAHEAFPSSFDTMGDPARTTTGSRSPYQQPASELADAESEITGQQRRLGGDDTQRRYVSAPGNPQPAGRPAGR
jgi:hypothetical protein